MIMKRCLKIKNTFQKYGECMIISSHKVLQKEKKVRQKSCYKYTRLIREDKLEPMPESRMSSYGQVLDMSIKLSIPKFN